MNYDLKQYEKAKTKDLIDCECNKCGMSFKRKKIQLYISIKRGQTELFCSKDCSYKFISKKYTYNINCKTCGLKVDYPKLFCNRSCAAKFTNKNILRKKGLKKEVNCSSCNINIIVSIHSSPKSFFCKSCKIKTKPKEKPPKSKKCSVCEKYFTYKEKNKKTCSQECLKKTFSYAGKKSSVSQGRRSKNEIYFHELCKERFFNVIHNEPIFNGWDADIIIPTIKVAVLWNGVWHYKKITHKHSLKQVQNRDRIKLNEIIKSGYIPYIIKDNGKYNKNKVNEEFKNFCKWLDEKVLQVVVPPHAQSRLMKPVGSLDLPAL
jgi:hypothetical protein